MTYSREVDWMGSKVVSQWLRRTAVVALREGVSSQAAAPGKLWSGLGLYSLGKHFCVLDLYSVSLVLDEIMEG